jgi:archaellum component FlaF (FlaF/FlaG flagellin family)
MTSTFDRLYLTAASNKNVSCEALGCNKKATAQVIVNVGNRGDITLNLCKKCVPKFDDSVVTKNSSSYSLPMDEEKKGVCNDYRVSTA